MSGGRVRFTREQLLEAHTKICFAAKDLMAAKNHDYTGGKDSVDVFANFREAVTLGHVKSVPESIFIRYLDKKQRLSSLLKKDVKVQGEGTTDTLLDMINYAVLTYVAILEEQANATNSQSNVNSGPNDNNVVSTLSTQGSGDVGKSVPSESKYRYVPDNEH